MIRHLSEADRQKVVALTAGILDEAGRYPWKTARYLSQVLANKRGFRIGPKTLEKALLEHARSKTRQVRYSFFPARKTLDLLWGHVRNINDFEALPDPFLEPDEGFLTEVGEFKPCELSEDAPWCFLSHNFRDLDAVRKLRRGLIDRGYGVWIAEAEIFEGDMITHKVQDGLERSHRFVLYMTRKSLGSRWVLKEAGVAINRWNLPPTIVADGNDPELVELFRPWLEGEWEAGPLATEIDRLLVDANEEPAATMLPELLIGALRDVPRERRRVVVYPDKTYAEHRGFATTDDEFPRQPKVE